MAPGVLDATGSLGGDDATPSVVDAGGVDAGSVSDATSDVAARDAGGSADADDDAATLDGGDAVVIADAADATPFADVPSDGAFDGGDAAVATDGRAADAVGVDVVELPDVPSVPNYHRVSSDVSFTTWRNAEPHSGIVTQTCAAGSVLAGLSIWSSRYVSGLAMWCAPLNADGTRGAVTAGAHQGGSNDHSDNDVCPAGQAVVRLTTHSGDVVDRLGQTCAAVSDWVSSGTLGATLPERGTSTGGGLAVDTCAAGYVAVGFEMRSSAYVLDVFIERLENVRLRCERIAPR